jgi:membrane protease YdiL (CAAX protease family)
VIASVPGALTTLPLVSALMCSYTPPPGKSAPPAALVRVLGVIQPLVLVAIAASIGIALAPRVGLRAPAFEALVAGQSAWNALLPQIGPALALGAIGGIVFVLAYYRVFRPRLSPEAIRITEGTRLAVGLPGRILYGGIVEEILARWGLMSLLAWLFASLAGSANAGAMWLAIVITGILFALGHFPAVVAQGLKVTGAVLATNLTLNLGASLIFGWLFWQIGLEAAMIAHAVFHLVWYPLEIKFHAA